MTDPTPQFSVTGVTYQPVVTVTDLEAFPEVLEMARGAADGWFADGPIDWEAVWERIDGSLLGSSFDSPRVDLGDNMTSPAMSKIQRTIRAERKAG